MVRFNRLNLATGILEFPAIRFGSPYVRSNSPNRGVASSRAQERRGGASLEFDEHLHDRDDSHGNLFHAETRRRGERSQRREIEKISATSFSASPRLRVKRGEG